ncbi:MAG: DNA mismatch repair protein MutS, partial [Leptospira sp.]|nr:DNA mismatch repair protein MutS [Leptospira sp.]
RAKTIFATHYHELTELDKGNGIFNLYLDTYEKEGEILFLKKVKKGKSKQSFGIYVAKLAGIPNQVTNRAKELLLGLESKKKEIKIKQEEPSLFSGILDPNVNKDSKTETETKILKRLNQIDTNQIPPMEALQILDELSRLAKEK